MNNILTENPQEAARRLAQHAIQKDFKPEALHVYQNQEGKILYYRIRLKHPTSGEKWIRPFQFIEGKGYRLGEPIFENGKPLYNLYRLTQQLQDPVWICEGEWCVDALTKIDVLATTSGAADSVGKADWQPLARRKIIIFPDNDEAGRRFATAAIKALQQLGCDIKIVDVVALNLPSKGDVVDWLHMHSNATVQDIAALPLVMVGESNGNNEDENSGRQSQASAIVNFVLERAELFHDENSEVYAFDSTTNETRRLDGRQFKDWLISSYYAMTGQSPRDQAVREALSTLGGIARFKGASFEVHIRVAKHDAAYYLDLGVSGQSHAVCITSLGWRVIENPPVRFLRPDTMRPLPKPVAMGDLSQLWQLVNIPEHDRLLVVAWLIESLRLDTPFPVLELIGEQGSAKSTTQTMLRRLIDPNACDLRAAPKKTEDIFVTGGVNWLVSYENISHLSPSMQDALCVLATGGGFAKRKLYSDADESVIIVKRPVILNGISVAITAQDLIDRAISIETPIMTQRVEINEIWRIYEEKHPELLGALLDVFTQALALLSTIQLPTADCPRLIEFTRLGMAIAEVTGSTSEAFLKAFNECRYESIARTIDASPVASALIEWFESNHKRTTILPIKTLFTQVERYRPNSTDSWPRSAKGFADALRRAAPALRQMGIECRSLGKIGSYVSWEIKQRE